MQQPSRIRIAFVEFVYGMTDEQCQIALGLVTVTKAERGAEAPPSSNPTVIYPVFSTSKN